MTENNMSENYEISINPATLDEVGRVEKSDLSLLPEQFKKARLAQKEWSTFSFKQRARHIMKMKKYIVAHVDDLAGIVSSDNGKSRIDALATEIIPCALAAKWYAKNTEKLLKPKKLAMSSVMFFNKKNNLIRVPMGVIGIISPWNYPLSIPFGEVVMGLMAGNAIFLKVAAATVMVGEAIERIVKAGDLPDGLFNHIVGSGSGVSKGFFENKVDKIFFTGSVPVGKILMNAASSHLTPLSLELGGKDPMIVLKDADLERASNGAAWAGFQNAGQSCGGVERLYVHETVYEPFLELLKKKTLAIRHGVDHDFNVDIGSMTTKDQWDTVDKQVKSALKDGAKIVAQSKGQAEDRGYFYPATLMTDVHHDMELMVEETFGPVIPVMPFKTVEEAIDLANDSTMALTSSVWTKNTAKGKAIAAQLQSGVTTINDHLYSHGQSETPWGGWKDSGLGRTHGELGLAEMTRPKLINWDILPIKRNVWWFPFDKATYDGLKSALYFSFPSSPWGFIVNGSKAGLFMIKKMFSSWKVKDGIDEEKRAD